MILTNKQIESRLDKFLDAHPGYQWDSTMAFRDMCKTQLKQVVKSPEWRYNLSALAYLELTTSPFWQELLKEVEDERK